MEMSGNIEIRLIYEAHSNGDMDRTENRERERDKAGRQTERKKEAKTD